MAQDFNDIYGVRINAGRSPEFDVVVELLDMFRKEAQKKRFLDYDGIIYMSVTSKQLKKRLAEKKINVNSRKACGIVTAFLEKNNIEYEPKRRAGGITAFTQIEYTHDKLKEWDAWALGFGMRELFYS